MTIPILPLMVSNLSHSHRHGNEKLPEGEVWQGETQFADDAEIVFSFPASRYMIE